MPKVKAPPVVSIRVPLLFCKCRIVPGKWSEWCQECQQYTQATGTNREVLAPKWTSHKGCREFATLFKMEPRPLKMHRDLAALGWPACKMHKRALCRACSCRLCGEVGPCSHSTRRAGPYSSGPRLIKFLAPSGPNRRVSVEIETEWESTVHRSNALRCYPHGYNDGSLQDPCAEFKIVRRIGELHKLAEIVGYIPTKGCKVTGRCGFHVHVDRTQSPDLDGPRLRWLSVQDALFTQVFPKRDGNSFCARLQNPEWGDIEGRLNWPNGNDHYTVLSATAKNTWEFRIHPGTVSPFIVACWTDWVTGLVEDRPSPLGEHYLAARIHTSGLAPRKWREAVEAWHAGHGEDYKRTLAEIASGRFQEHECNPDRVPKWNMNWPLPRKPVYVDFQGQRIHVENTLSYSGSHRDLIREVYGIEHVPPPLVITDWSDDSVTFSQRVLDHFSWAPETLLIQPYLPEQAERLVIREIYGIEHVPPRLECEIASTEEQYQAGFAECGPCVCLPQTSYNYLRPAQRMLRTRLPLNMTQAIIREVYGIEHQDQREEE